VVSPRKPQAPAPIGLRPNGRAPAPSEPWPADTRIAVEVWSERDRLMVRVVEADTKQEIACWWDDDARSLVDAGLLDPRDWKRSAEDYLRHLGVVAPGRP
jgi:hypothetical protein